MANTTDPFAQSVHGTNPQFLVEKITRLKVYNSVYWKEECFGLTAETIIDKAVALKYVGGNYGGNIKPCNFLCLVLKMLQLQPEKEIVLQYIMNEDFKYVRALGAFYMRLVGKADDIYKYLEPLYNDYRKLAYRGMSGWQLMCMDEFVDAMFRDELVCDIALPHLLKREKMEELHDLPPRKSALDLELLEEDEEEEKNEDGEVNETGTQKNGQTKGAHTTEEEAAVVFSDGEEDDKDGGGGGDGVERDNGITLPPQRNVNKSLNESAAEKILASTADLLVSEPGSTNTKEHDKPHRDYSRDRDSSRRDTDKRRDSGRRSYSRSPSGDSRDGRYHRRHRDGGNSRRDGHRDSRDRRKRDDYYSSGDDYSSDDGGRGTRRSRDDDRHRRDRDSRDRRGGGGRRRDYSEDSRDDRRHRSTASNRGRDDSRDRSRSRDRDRDRNNRDKNRGSGGRDDRRRDDSREGRREGGGGDKRRRYGSDEDGSDSDGSRGYGGRRDDKRHRSDKPAVEVYDKDDYKGGKRATAAAASVAATSTAVSATVTTKPASSKAFDKMFGKKKATGGKVTKEIVNTQGEKVVITAAEGTVEYWNQIRESLGMSKLK